METYEELVQRWENAFKQEKKVLKSEYMISILLGSGGIAFMKDAIDKYARMLENTPNTSRNCTLKLKNRKIVEK